MATRIFVKTSELKKLSLFTRDLSRNVVRKAVARSIKRALKTLGKTAVQEFRSAKLINMKAAKLKKNLRTYEHTGAGKPLSEQYGELTISGKPQSIAYFYAKQYRA